MPADAGLIMSVGAGLIIPVGAGLIPVVAELIMSKGNGAETQYMRGNQLNIVVKARLLVFERARPIPWMGRPLWLPSATHAQNVSPTLSAKSGSHQSPTEAK